MSGGRRLPRIASRATISVGAAVALAALAAPGAAYETKRSPQSGAELRWHALPVAFEIHSAAAPGVSAAQTQDAVRAAYATWAKVTCSTFDVLDQGVVDNAYGSRTDGVCTNAWVPAWPASYLANALAMTLTEYDDNSGEITDSDTHYNPDRLWSTSGSALALDIQAVATHEIGHQLGLAHPPVPGATMYFATGNGDTAPRSLHSDDIAGICHLYPSGLAVPDECVLPDDCAPSETCDQGSCLPASGAKKGYGGPCTTALDCLSAYCIKTSVGDLLCTQLCDTEPCPNGDDCVNGTTPSGQQYRICKPSTANLAQALGAPCQTPVQCASQLCVSVPGRGDLCSQACDVAANDCPAGYLCVPGDLGGLCIPAPDPPAAPVADAAPPAVNADLGAPTPDASGASCANGDCPAVDAGAGGRDGGCALTDLAALGNAPPLGALLLLLAIALRGGGRRARRGSG